MAENKFGRTSRLVVETCLRDGKTVLQDLFFTAPYKVMTPFPKTGGGLSIIPMCASAGIMEGDCQEFSFRIGEKTDLELLSQSFEKIHKMKTGYASRRVQADIEKNGAFYYYPQPVIPYADSAFESTMEFHLADESAKFFFLDVISCGRSASGEQFAYRRFASRVEVFRGEAMIYRDNTCYEPARMDMKGLGMYEGYTHAANLFLAGGPVGLKEKIWKILEEQTDCEGGVTALCQGDLAVRIFGRRGQRLQQIADQIKQAFEEGPESF